MRIVQAGEPVLRREARALSAEEIRGERVQQLIEAMRETMRRAPGVGLAAPQVGESLQLAVIEDREEYLQDIPQEVLAERGRAAVPFHVIINPEITIYQPSVEFIEGCLSLSGFAALVPRGALARVRCLDHRGEEIVIDASGWYARILQHEIDHLQGRLYIDRMRSRSFMTLENYARHWGDKTVEQMREELGLLSEQGEQASPS
jgi:peptide deformylase